MSISYTNYLYSICEQLKAIIIAEFPRFGAKNRLLFKKLNIVDLAEVKFRFLNNMVKCLRISNNKYIIAESVLDSISDSDFWLYDKSVDRYLNVDSACVNISNGVSFGVMRAKINNHNRGLKRLDACKMEKDVANSQFNAINEKLDLLLKYFSKGEK